MNARPYLREVSLKRDGIEDAGAYPFDIPAVRKLDRLQFHRDVTFLIGENGCGKSTLLEGIAGGWEQHLRLVKSPYRPRDGFFLRAESFFNVATSIDEIDADPSGGPPVIGAYGGRSLHEQSHGESFLALLLHRFRGRGLYILDEPEAALSPTRQLAVLCRMHQLVQAESQFIVATHSPIVMAYPGARILLLDAEGFRAVRYEETEHYAVTREFLADPAHMLKQLLADDDKQAKRPRPRR